LDFEPLGGAQPQRLGSKVTLAPNTIIFTKSPDMWRAKLPVFHSPVVGKMATSHQIQSFFWTFMQYPSLLIEARYHNVNQHV